MFDRNHLKGVTWYHHMVLIIRSSKLNAQWPSNYIHLMLLLCIMLCVHAVDFEKSSKVMPKEEFKDVIFDVQW